MQKRFSHYYLTEQVGSKPLRSAYIAHSVNDASQKVLLKIFDATCLALGQENERLLYQVEWIKQLRHIHVVPILDLGVEQGLPYVVSEYLSGGSLRHRLNSLSSRRLSFEEALRIIMQVGQAICYFHESAHLHQNIKPENIFFNGRDEALLTDFRLSGFIDVSILDYQSDPRNMCYMAPEQFVGSGSEKSDQYGLACLAYELFTGQVPFSAQSFAMMWASHYAQFPIPLSDIAPDLPKWIGKVIFKAMAKDPSERYADIATFLLALEGTASSPVSAITKPPALSTLDPFSVGVEEPLKVSSQKFGTDQLVSPGQENHDKSLSASLPQNIEMTPPKDRKSDTSITAGLAGIPPEGSLATAPFGVGLESATFGASLVSAAFETSLLGAPFGIGLPENPFTASLSGMALATSQEGEILEEIEKENSFTTNLAENMLEMNQKSEILEKEEEEKLLEKNLAGNVTEVSQQSGMLEKEEEEKKLLEKNLAENVFEMGQKGEILEKQEEAPFERNLAGNMFEMSLAGNVFEAGLHGNILESALRQDPFEKNLAEGIFDISLTGNAFEIEQEEDFLQKLLGENPFEIGLVDTPLTTRLLERWERASNEPPSTNLDTPAGPDRSDSSEERLWNNAKYTIPGVWSGRPHKPSVATVWLTQLRGYLRSLLIATMTGSRRVLILLSKLPAHLLELWLRVSSKHDSKKVIDSFMEYVSAKLLLVRRIFQLCKDWVLVVLFGQRRELLVPALWFKRRRELPTPALWLVLVLSIIVLVGGVTTDIFLAMQSPGQFKSMNLGNKHQTISPIDNQLIAQPVAHMSVPQQSNPSSLLQTSLTGSYAEQNQTYNLNSEGGLDWVDWGLRMPGDVNRKSGVPQQISTFSVIGGGIDPSIVLRASYNTNARLWWSNGIPVVMAQPQQASGVYVRGGEGFSFTVPASALPRTLRVYVAVNGAQGKFTASLGGKTYVDESLSSAYDPNGPQVNGVYTLVFSDSIPNQVLTVTYTQMTTYGINGCVLLRAASLH